MKFLLHTAQTQPDHGHHANMYTHCTGDLMVFWGVNSVVRDFIHIVALKFFHEDVYLEKPTFFINALVVIDFGRSMGSPRARSQIVDAMQPRARDTPNNTV